MKICENTENLYRFRIEIHSNLHTKHNKKNTANFVTLFRPHVIQHFSTKF